MKARAFFRATSLILFAAGFALGCERISNEELQTTLKIKIDAPGAPAAAGPGQPLVRKVERVEESASAPKADTYAVRAALTNPAEVFIIENYYPGTQVSLLVASGSGRTLTVEMYYLAPQMSSDYLDSQLYISSPVSLDLQGEAVSVTVNLYPVSPGWIEASPPYPVGVESGGSVVVNSISPDAAAVTPLGPQPGSMELPVASGCPDPAGYYAVLVDLNFGLPLPPVPLTLTNPDFALPMYLDNVPLARRFRLTVGHWDSVMKAVATLQTEPSGALVYLEFDGPGPLSVKILNADKLKDLAYGELATARIGLTGGFGNALIMVDGLDTCGGSIFGYDYMFPAPAKGDTCTVAVYAEDCSGESDYASAVARTTSSDPLAGLWVSPLGSDTMGNGTSAAPFATISRAVSAAAPGSIIKVMNGVYYDLINIGMPLSILGGFNPADPSAPRQPAAFPVAVVGDSATPVVTIHDTSGVVIDGLNIFRGPMGVYNSNARSTLYNNVISNTMIGVGIFGTPLYNYDTVSQVIMTHSVITRSFMGVMVKTYSAYDYYGGCHTSYGTFTGNNNTMTNLGYYAFSLDFYDDGYCDPTYEPAQAIIRNTIVDHFDERFGNGFFQTDYSCFKASAPSYDAGSNNLSNCYPVFWFPMGFGPMPGDTSVTIDAGDPDPSFNDQNGTRNDMGATGASSFFFDNDFDGMADAWEIRFGLNPASASDGTGDLDGDGAENYKEFSAGSDPTLTDTDADGVSDGYEIQYIMCMFPVWDDSLADPDGDTLTNLFEFTDGGTNGPCSPDF